MGALDQHFSQAGTCDQPRVDGLGRSHATAALAGLSLAEEGNARALAPLLLPMALVDRLEGLARHRGCPIALLTEELLLQALEQAEALPSARCSTRLGRCSVGPVPLPYQQH